MGAEQAQVFCGAATIAADDGVTVLSMADGYDGTTPLPDRNPTPGERVAIGLSPDKVGMRTEPLAPAAAPAAGGGKKRAKKKRPNRRQYVDDWDL